MVTFDVRRFRHCLIPTIFLSLIIPPTCAHGDDGFKFYAAATALKSEALAPRTTRLTDAIESKLTTVPKRTRVCNRAAVGSSAALDPVANWTCYALKQAKGEAKFLKRDIHVRDALGVHRFALTKASQLCVISERDATGAPAPSDDLKCYAAANAKGAAKLSAINLGVADDLEGSRVTKVKKPTMLCAPVDREGLGTIDPSEYWMCYQIADAKTVPKQPKFKPVNVAVANAFEGADPRTMSVKKPTELCLPATAHLEGANGNPGPHFCTANRDCGSSFYCASSGVCAPAGTGAVGATCDAGADCDATLVCDRRGVPGTCATAGTHDLAASCLTTVDCLAGLVCSPGGTCSAPRAAYADYGGVSCATDESTFYSYFEVPRPGAPPKDFFRLPFPNDVRAGGMLDLGDFPRPGPSVQGVDIVDLFADAFAADFRGFSSVAPVVFRFSKELDPASLGPNGENLHYVDITPFAPALGSEHSFTYEYTPGRGLFICQHTLTVRSNTRMPLLPGHTYAVFVTTAIRSAKGDPPVQAPDLTALLASSAPADAALTATWTKYQSFRDYLTAAPISSATIAAGTVFTVQDATARMKSLASAVASSPLPVLTDVTLCDGTTTSPCDDGGVRACGAPDPAFFEIHGRFSIPNYQQGTSPFETPADGGGIVFDAGDVPVQQGTLEVCFALTVPKSTPPAAGWPLVVHAHGTGGSFRSFVTDGIATTLATASPPMATLSFDGIAHGARRGASTRNSESLVFNVVNPRAARDNHLQGAVDVIQALRVAQQTPFLAGAVQVSFDASKTYFFGHSQGANIGISAMATTDLASAAVLSGASASRPRLIVQRYLLEPHEAALRERATSVHPLLTLVQSYLDPADPIDYAPLLLHMAPPGVSSKHVYMSWGAGDTIAPTAAISELARAVGLRVADPVLATIGTPTVARPISGNVLGSDGVGRTAALFQYAPDGTYDGHLVALRHTSAVADWRGFLTSAVTTGTPTVP